MAEFVLGIASSHGPQLSVPAENWALFGEKDKNDRRMDFEALLARELPGIQDELQPDRMKARYDASHAAMDQLRKKVADVAPDVIIVIGDDQHEQFLDSNMPMFSVYYGDSISTVSQRREERPSPIAAPTGGGDRRRSHRASI